MTRDIIVVEDFYADPDAVVRYARGLEYVYPYQQPGTAAEGQRITWRASRYRSARECPFKSSRALIARLESLVGEPIDLDAWNSEFPVDADGYPLARATLARSAWWHCCFHAKPDVGQEVGAGVHSHVDQDFWNPVGLDGWAGLVYLNRGNVHAEAGLRTWDHRDPRRRHEWMTPKENWILRDTFANSFNRLILHRGRIPHSGANGWGESVADGRLFQTFFFRVKRHHEVSALTPAELGILG